MDVQGDFSMKILYDRVYELELSVSTAKSITNDVVKNWELLKIYKEILIDLGLLEYYNSYRKNKEVSNHE